MSDHDQSNNSSIAIKHNKKRNVGLLYEMLARHVIDCTMKKKNSDKVFEIIKKHFNSKSILREELNLFNVIISVKGSERKVVERVLKEVSEYAKKINVKDLDKGQSKIIREINYNLSSDVYNHKVKDYKLFATTQLFLNACRDNSPSRSIERAHLTESLISQLCEVVEQKTITHKGNFLFLTLMSDLSKKLENLTPSQKSIMKEYVDLVLAGKGANELLNKYISETNTILNKALSDKTFNSDTKKKIDESIKRFSRIINEGTEKDKIDSIIRYRDLIEEMKR